MARYVFSIVVNGGCVYYDESTVEQDKADAGLAEFGGSGYLSFWRSCKEVMLEFNRLRDAVRGMKHFGDMIPDLQYLTEGGNVEAIITDLDYDVEKKL